jgi:predicted RND superfamily exporter protein
MIVLIVTRRESKAESWRDAFLPLLLGFLATFLELGALGLLHLALIQRVALPV